MKPENFDINQLIEHLKGTCKSLDEGINDLYPEMSIEDLTEEDHGEIDNEIFNCDTCNWWVEIGDMGADGENCMDCSTEEFEDN